MAPNKTKRLSSFDEPPQTACIPALKARRSSRMAIKRAFSTAKFKPITSLSNPLIIDSELPPQNPNPPVPPHNPNPGGPRPIRDRVRTFHGAHPKISKKRRKFDSQEVGNQTPPHSPPVPAIQEPEILLAIQEPENPPVPELLALDQEPDYSLPVMHAPHLLPAALCTSPLRAPPQPSSPRRAPAQPSRQPVAAAVRSSPRRAPPHPSRHPVAAAVRSSPRRAPPQPSRHPVAATVSSSPRRAPQRSSSHAPALQQSSAQPQRSFQHPRGPPPPSIQQFSQQLSPRSTSQPPPPSIQPPQPPLQASLSTESANQIHQPASQPNDQGPKKSKSIRVKLGEDIEEEKRYRRGLVNGLKLEIHCHTLGGKIKVDKDVNSDTPANNKVPK